MNKSKPLLSQGLYETIKACVELGLPGAATLYFAFSQIWGLPYGEQVVASAAALATFLGVVLVIARIRYNKSDAAFQGEVLVDRHPEADRPYELLFNEPVANLVETNKAITLKVVERPANRG